MNIQFEIKNQIIKQLKENIISLQAIYIYGSQADGTAKNDSDIDIAIVCEEEIDSVKVFSTAQDLSVEINKKIDLVDMAKVGIVLQFEAIKHRQRIWTGHSFDHDTYEHHIMREYYDHRLDMQPIYEDIRKTGVVNG